MLSAFSGPFNETVEAVLLTMQVFLASHRQSPRDDPQVTSEAEQVAAAAPRPPVLDEIACDEVAGRSMCRRRPPRYVPLAEDIMLESNF